MSNVFTRIGLVIEALLVGSSENPEAAAGGSALSEGLADRGATPPYSGHHSVSLLDDGACPGTEEESTS